MQREPFSDTSPEAERVQIEILRRMPPWKKLQMVGELCAMSRALASIGLRERHPDDTPEALRLRLAELMLGRALAEKVYGKLPE